MDTISTGKTLILTKSRPMHEFNCVAIVLILICTILSITNAVECPERCNSCRGGVVDCHNKSLTAPPKAYPPDTRIINLEKNHIRIVGTRTFRRGQTAEVLKLGHNRITTLRNDAFRSFPRVMSLDLTGNRITRIYNRGLAGLSRLRTLFLRRNRIRRINAIFRGFPNLQQLNLANNRIIDIRKNDYSTLTRMRILDLRGNSITVIHPEAFDKVTNLRYLFLNDNPIGDAVVTLQLITTRLQLLDMSDSQLTEFPTSLPATLSELRLGRNRITQINYTAFENVTDLRMLALNENELHFFDDDALTHLSKLKEIWLRGNNLVYVPRDIPSSVERIHMDSNNIQEIEQGIFPDDSQLIHFSVENNNLRRINPETFTSLSNLQMINLQRNQLQTLEPITFADLENLQTIKLSTNPLQRIEADAFKNLTSLTEISLNYLEPDTTEINGNFLLEMPNLQKIEMMASPGMGHAFVNMISGEPFISSSVTIVDLSYNNIQSIFQPLKNAFPNVSKMLLDGNPFQCTEQLQWLRDWMTTTEVQFHRYEVITCDTPISLKGSPIRTITDQEFREADQEFRGSDSTGGVNRVVLQRSRRNHGEPGENQDKKSNKPELVPVHQELREGGNTGVADRGTLLQRSGRTRGELSENEDRKSKKTELVPVPTEKENKMSEKHLALREEREKRRRRRRRNRSKNGKGRKGRKRRRRGKKNKKRKGKKRDRKNKNKKKTQT